MALRVMEEEEVVEGEKLLQLVLLMLKQEVEVQLRVLLLKGEGLLRLVLLIMEEEEVQLLVLLLRGERLLQLMLQEKDEVQLLRKWMRHRASHGGGLEGRG